MPQLRPQGNKTGPVFRPLPRGCLLVPSADLMGLSSEPVLATVQGWGDRAFSSLTAAPAGQGVGAAGGRWQALSPSPASVRIPCLFFLWSSPWRLTGARGDFRETHRGLLPGRGDALSASQAPGIGSEYRPILLRPLLTPCGWDSHTQVTNAGRPPRRRTPSVAWRGQFSPRGSGGASPLGESLSPPRLSLMNPRAAL